MSNKAMYILVNENLKIGKGKLAGQTAHASLTWLYRNFIKDYSGNHIEITEEMQNFLDECPQSKLEELEKEQKYIVIRDKGLTQLEPNTLTCICIGIFDRDTDEVPEWVKELKLYN